MTTSTQTAPRVPVRPEPPAKMTRTPRLSRLAGLAFLVPVALFLAIFLIYPIGRGIVLSLQEWTIRSFVTGEAPFVGLQNFVRVVSDAAFLPITWQTVLFTSVSLLFQYVFGLALGVFFARRFPLSILLRSLILLPWLLPVTVSATIWRWMLNQDYGVVNAVLFGGADVGWLSNPDLSLWAVIIANIWLGIPFNLVLLYGGLQAIPRTLYEAAALDGAGPWRSFCSITLPLLRPVTAVTLLLGLIYTLKAFDIIWIITRGGPVNSSHTLATWSYQISFEGDRALGEGAALSQILVIVALAFGLLYLWALRREARR